MPSFNPLSLLSLLGLGDGRPSMSQAGGRYNVPTYGGGGRTPPGRDIPGVTFDPRGVTGGPPPGGQPTSAPPSSGGRQGFFDPKTTAIDTTNPHALPIIQMIQQYLLQQGRRTSDPRRNNTGPMSQLYRSGQPAPTAFDPVNAGSTQIRSYQPQYMNQYTANNFDPEALIRSL